MGKRKKKLTPVGVKWKKRLTWDERVRWAKYPLATEAIKTETFRKHKAKLKRTTDHIDAWCHEKAINEAIRVLKIRRMARLLAEKKK